MGGRARVRDVAGRRDSAGLAGRRDLAGGRTAAGRRNLADRRNLAGGQDSAGRRNSADRQDSTGGRAAGGTRQGRTVARAAALAAALCAWGALGGLAAQESAGGEGMGGEGAGRPVRSLEALRLADAAPTVDGVLDEPVWASAMAARDFVVFQPNEGDPASQRTEARVLYGTDAIYVGIRAFDEAPDSIVSRLARRDERPHSDWVDVVVDSYHDRRTAFGFGVNPSGVKVDVYYFDDTSEDTSWDAVWDVATTIDDGGWTAEFRIPYSQLRFNGAARQTWGINFRRVVARHLEHSLWAPISRGDGAIVSRFGHLEGLRDLSPPRRLEVLPYSLARLESLPGAAEDPFHDPRDFSYALGGDVKYGLTTDLTLDLTINPDFGQVEADPAEVNLTAFESFFSERRPFFVEGANIFSFGFSPGDDDGGENLFYSRRIGRAPRGRVASGLYADAPDRTRIAGALKLSGKTQAGWSVGLLHALTTQEEAHRAADGRRLEPQVVEPRAHYGVGRISKDFRGGKSSLGAISTWTVRDGTEAAALGLHDGAYAAGVDGRHRFGDDRFLVEGYFIGTTVRGSEEALARTQRAPARYYQRPDAEHTEFDPERTELGGWAGSATFGKIAGGFWRYAAGFMARSPGFEANDAGFMREADFASPWVWLGYNRYKPSERFQRWNVNVNAWTSHSFGGERYSTGGNVNSNFTLSNFWGGYLGVNHNTEGLSNTTLRGGPMFLRDPAWNGWGGFRSDSRKPLRVNVGANWSARPESGSWGWGANLNLHWRPSSSVTVSAGPFLNVRNEDLQWVRRFGGDAPAYLFGELKQATAGATTRASWTFSPTLSLQVYAQPFMSAGEYAEFKRIADPRAEAYADRYERVETLAVRDGRIEADVDGDGAAESFRNPDFSVKQFRSNVVLRWEYQPGSAIFVAWSQGRDHYAQTGEFSLGDVGTLFDEPSQDVFMVKMSYWIG